MSTQWSYASSDLALGRMQGVRATESELVRIAAKRSEYTWQTLVLRSGIHGNESGGGSAVRSEAVTYARFDTPHKVAPSPWMLAQWSEDFGWHRSLEQIAARQSASPEKGIAPILSDEQSQEQVEQRTKPVNGFAISPSIANGSLASERAHLSQMLAEAAHDIRSPIAVAQQIIAILAQRARRGGQLTDLETGLLEAAQMRLTQANRWAEGILVEQSLAHGQPVNVRRRFYPIQWLRGVQPLLNSLAIERGVSLAWLGWDRSLPRLYLDANHLSRAVLNLVSNSIQASQPGSQVRVEVAWQTHVTQRLVISIDDRGSGLPAELLRQINSSSAMRLETPQAACAGVGLETAGRLVRALGGSIMARVRSGGGTQVRVMLPVDNYHSLIHSWLQQHEVAVPPQAALAGSRVTIHVLRGSKCEDAKSMWQSIDSRLQQATSSSELVYRVAPDRWLWLSLQAATSPDAIPHTLSQVLQDLRELDNAWNRPLVCRHQQVFQWQPSDAACHSQSIRNHALLMSLTSKLAEKVAELVGDHVPPLDELQTGDATIAIRPQSGGPARLIRTDCAQGAGASVHLSRFAARTPPSGSLKRSVGRMQEGTSLADTPCETFSGSLVELTQQWHVRQRQLDQTSAALGLR